MGTKTWLGAALPEQQPQQLRQVLQKGIAAESLATFKAQSAMADEELAQALEMSPRSLNRLRASRAQRLPADTSDRLYALSKLYSLAEDVFKDRATALGWLREPQFALGNERPRDWLSSEYGREQVRALLERLRHGQVA
jgi:putative toxin-antitoxin system antitoxin component (TIGR02293 family)